MTESIRTDENLISQKSFDDRRTEHWDCGRRRILRRVDKELPVGAVRQTVARKHIVLGLLMGLLLFPPRLRAQGWTFVGKLPAPAGSTQLPYSRGWTKPVYDPVAHQLVLYWANPNCCSGTFSNALFHYAVGTNTWTPMWTHDTNNPGSFWKISTITRSAGVVSATITNGPANLSPGDPMLVTQVTDSTFNGTFRLVSASPSQVTWAQAGSDAVSSGGVMSGPGDNPKVPADRHTYHAIAWDTTRNVMWTGFGSAVVGGTSANCGDCGISDFYSFSPTRSSPWTEWCGFGTTACPSAIGTLQEAAAAYDPTNDVVVIYGGLATGMQMNRTWAYYPAANAWKEVCGGQGQSACGPPELRRAGLVSIGDGKLVMFGGQDAGTALYNQTWIFDTTTLTWTQEAPSVTPPAIPFPVMDYVPKLGKVILIGNESTGAHVWAFDPGTGQWQDLNVPPGPTLGTTRSLNQGAYDPGANRFVLFTLKDGRPRVWSLALPGSTHVLLRPSR